MEHLFLFLLICGTTNISLFSQIKPPNPPPKRKILKEDTNQVQRVIAYAEPEGGMEAFYKYVKKKFKYPKEARKAGIGGKVFVQFTVHKDGHLSDISVVKGLHEACDQEALRIMRLYETDKKAPKWIIGDSKGRTKQVKVVIPILFKLKEKDENEK